MNHVRFLKVALPVIAIPALVGLLLPARIWPTYFDVVEPLSLLVGAFLALWVSFSYSKELRAAFIFLSVFLLIYAFAIVLFLSFYPILPPILESRLENPEILSLLQAVQFINYAMLFFFCINILRVVDVTRLDKRGWVLVGLTVPFCGVLAIYPVAPVIAGIWTRASPVITYVTTHLINGVTTQLINGAGIIVLVPVLWLYVQHLRSRHRQTLTFTVIVSGTALGLTILFWVFMIIYPVLSPIQVIWTQSLPAISNIGIRLLDAALIIVLVPVLWLYVQHLKSQQRQSLTFTVVISGVVFFTLFDYLFQVVLLLFPRLLPQGSHLSTTISEALFVYGYLMILIGLYAHRKEDEWGYKAVDRAMSGELKLVESGKERQE